MAYLYGDGTPSPHPFDYLDYLRRAIALAVEVVLIEDQLIATARRRAAVQARTAALEAKLEALVLKVREAIGETARAPEDNPVTRCANDIENVVDQSVARAVRDVHAQHEATIAALAARERKAHAECLAALETFLRRHDLPETARELALEEGAVVLRGATPYAVATEVELDGAGSPFAAAEVRATALAAPRLRAVKLERMLVTAARCDAETIEVELRASRDAGADGLDVAVERASGRVTASARRRGATEPLDASADAEGLLALARAVADALEALAPRRRRVRHVTIDDVPLDEHERPSELVDRVLCAMAPAVRAIVDHSRVPGELSLRRALGGDRREEIFVAHATLAEVVGQVPVARRRHFEVLGIPGLTGARPPSIVEPAPPDASEPSISIDHGEADQ